jgi:hypothetical protein
MTKAYEGRIEHNTDTIRRMFKATYYKYEMKKVLVWLLVGATLIVLGLVGKFSLGVQGILMMIGCWIVVSRDFPSKIKADRTLELRKQALPTIITTFYKDYVELNGEGRMKLQYDRFQYLLEDQVYLFLFIDKDSVCMIDSRTLKPDNLDQFKKFVSEKTNLDWKQNVSLLHMSFMDLLQYLKK